jgi:hypothetical protein
MVPECRIDVEQVPVVHHEYRIRCSWCTPSIICAVLSTIFIIFFLAFMAYYIISQM